MKKHCEENVEVLVRSGQKNAVCSTFNLVTAPPPYFKSCFPKIVRFLSNAMMLWKLAQSKNLFDIWDDFVSRKDLNSSSVSQFEDPFHRKIQNLTISSIFNVDHHGMKEICILSFSAEN